MKVASLNLCKELYELSGWHIEPDRPLKPGEMFTPPQHYDSVDHKFYPAYDLGYLLRKLPKSRRVQLSMSKRSHWTAATAGFRDTQAYKATADTPEDAACKLAIELFKKGVLTK